MFYINMIPSPSLFHSHKSEDPFLSPFLSTSRQHVVQVHHPILLRCKMYSNVHSVTHSYSWYCSGVGVQMYCHYLIIRLRGAGAQMYCHCTWQILHHLAVSSYVHLRKLAPRGNLGNYLPNRESVWTGSISLKYLRSIPRNVSRRVHLEFSPEAQ